MLCRATPGRPKPDVDRNFMAKKRHTGGDVSIKWPESVASRWKRPPQTAKRAGLPRPRSVVRKDLVGFSVSRYNVVQRESKMESSVRISTPVAK